jgi:hypothetical protein
MPRDLTETEKNEMRRFIAEQGRYWKARLRDMHRGPTKKPWPTSADAKVLGNLVDELGHAWLDGFKAEDLAAPVMRRPAEPAVTDVIRADREAREEEAILREEERATMPLDEVKALDAQVEKKEKECP